MSAAPFAPSPPLPAAAVPLEVTSTGAQGATLTATPAKSRPAARKRKRAYDDGQVGRQLRYMDGLRNDRALLKLLRDHPRPRDIRDMARRATLNAGLNGHNQLRDSLITALEEGLALGLAQLRGEGGA